MDVFLFIVAVVALSVGAKTLKSFFDYRAQVKAFELQTKQFDQADVEQELSCLKERVEILEKLVTDNGYQLDKEIRSLSS